MLGEAMEVLKTTSAVDRQALTSELMNQITARATGGPWMATEMLGANGARVWAGEYHSLVVNAAGNVFKGPTQGGITFGMVNGRLGVTDYSGLRSAF